MRLAPKGRRASPEGLAPKVPWVVQGPKVPPGRKVLPGLREPKDIKGSKALPAQQVVLAVLALRDFKVSLGLRGGLARKVR